MNTVLWKIGAVLALVAALISIDTWRVHEADQAGFDRATSQRAERDRQQKITDGEQAARDTKTRQDKADADALARQQEKDKYEATIDDLRLAARRGNSGMRAPGTCVPKAATGASTGAAGGPVAETGYVLLPETAGSVLDTAAYIRQSVLDRNKLIDEYNVCRAAANTP